MQASCSAIISVYCMTEAQPEKPARTCGCVAIQVTTHAEFEQVASIMDRLEDLPAWHVLGNHDINYISRDAWLSRLKVRGRRVHFQREAEGADKV